MPSVGIAPVALQQFFDSDGNPLAGGKLYTYASTTTTPLATYTDYTGSTPNPNPLILDSGGFASPGLYLQALAYTFALFDVNNIPQWSQDGVVSAEAVAGLNTPSQQNFATSGTFVVPTNVSAAKVTVLAGGGAGGGSSSVNNGSGGGAGGVSYAWLTGLIPGNTITVTVGAAGVGVSNNTGGTGGNSSISSGTQTITTVTANGGLGGATGAGVPGAGVGGAVGTGGSLNFGGNAGGLAASSTVSAFGGPGAGSVFGGGASGVFAAAGMNAIAAGAGGGGAGFGANHAGGNGFAGLVLFEYLQ